MTERDDGLAAILDRLVPPIENPEDDWQRIVADARLDEMAPGWEAALRSRRPRTRRPPVVSARRPVSPKVGLAMGLLAACGLIAGAVVVFGGAGRHRANVPPQRVAGVMHRVLVALSVSNNLILQETIEPIGQPTGAHSTPLRHEQWADPASGRVRGITYGPGGQPINQSSMLLTGHTARISTVIYQAHVWQTTTDRLPGPSAELPGAKDLANMIREQAASRAFALVGTGTINGHPVVQLRRAPALRANTAPGQQPATGMTITIWVDASDYLPVRQETSVGRNVTSRTTYTWLPPSVVNRAKLNLVVPPGFTHTTASSGTTPAGSWSVTSGVVTFPHTHP